MTHDPYAALAELVACKDASPFNYRSTSAVNTDGKAEAEHYRREREAWSAARAALAQRAEPEPTITYAHKAAPDGPRFRQYPGDLLPVWAVDIRNEAAPQAQRAEPVAWQQRFIDPDEGLGVWQSCDDNTRRILQGRSDYELRPLYAAPQAQQVSGAADPAGSPAGEQTGPVSAAPTYTPQAQPAPLSDEEIWAAVGAKLDDSMVKLKDVLPIARAIERAVTERLSVADELAQLEPLIARSRALYEEWARAVERLRGQS